MTTSRVPALPAAGAAAPGAPASTAAIPSAAPTIAAAASEVTIDAAARGDAAASTFMELLAQLVAAEPAASPDAAVTASVAPEVLGAAGLSIPASSPLALAAREALPSAGEEDAAIGRDTNGEENGESWLALPELLQALLAAEGRLMPDRPAAETAAKLAHRESPAPVAGGAVQVPRPAAGESRIAAETSAPGLPLVPFDAHPPMAASPVIDTATSLVSTSEKAPETTAMPQVAAHAASFARADCGIAAAHAMAAAAAPQSPQAPRPELPLHVLHEAVGSAEWSRELGAELLLLSEKGQQAASLRLVPEHLGPLEVRIAVREGEATLQFAAPHADTRTALEQALPRLRELFAAQGLTIADAGFFQQESRHPARTGASVRAGAEGVRAEEPDAVTASASAQRIGLVDTYA